MTNQYNMIMKKILPKHGTEVVKMSRKSINGKCISASVARKYMEENYMY